MTVLQESPECFIQQCKECGAILKYSLHDIHPEAVPYFNEDGEQTYCAGFESIMCPCCKHVIPVTKEWFYGTSYGAAVFNINSDSKNR
jgi:hypothetical protein